MASVQRTLRTSVAAGGSGLGAIATTWTYARAGWNGVCGLGAAVSGLALAVWALTLRSAAASR
ncbi:hypothetical protein [Luteimonas sp. TWI1416]|uniref:hypothetical protein n=1 Tax=unclassified Luteimonas TaxID=2629088 RepID=UPI00320A56F4